MLQQSYQGISQVDQPGTNLASATVDNPWRSVAESSMQRSARALALFAAVCSASPTDFPLYAILSDAREIGSPTEEDLTVIATNFTAIQGSFHDKSGEEYPSLFYNYSSSIRPLHYISTWATNDMQMVETGLHDATLHYASGTLEAHVSSIDTTLSFNYGDAGRHSWVVPPSTASGDVSRSCSEYVSWLRVGDEIVKVLQVSQGTSGAPSVSVQVQRGFGGTTASSHPSGELAMAPVYNSNSYPNAPGCDGQAITYESNPATSFGVDMVVNQSLTAILERNFSGVWLDCFSSQPFQAVDAAGGQLRALGLGQQPDGAQVWDTSVQPPVPFTARQYRVREQQRLRRVWEQIRGRSGAWPAPTVYANNLDTQHFRDDRGDGGGAVRLMMPGQQIPAWPGNSTLVPQHPLDGYSNEAFALHEVGTCQWSVPEYIAQGQWEENVVMVQNLSAQGLPSRPMAAQAGCKSPGLEKLSYADRDRYEGFAYASYLLTVSRSAAGGESTAFGIPAMYRRNVTAPNGTVVDVDFWAEVHPRYFLGLGEPVTSTRTGSLEGYTLFWDGSRPRNTLGRRFEHGLVLVNPSNVTEGPLPLNGTLRQFGTGKVVS